ncbi:hypothetical protein HanLR1_Chr10g0352491 [Helianthus annuus]|nr:hypothetical protein HanHA89_Chr10g0374641 [Helianthus annuus]KAJ0696045.1 hypothetical protein HanLR1_Chr10g0352491 [Helianthus annuus]
MRHRHWTKGVRAELLGTESSQRVVSLSLGLEILPRVVCALATPSQGPSAGPTSLMAPPTLGPVVSWTKSMIAARVAELESTRRTIGGAVSMGGRSDVKGPVKSGCSLRPVLSGSTVGLDAGG